MILWRILRFMCEDIMITFGEIKVCRFNCWPLLIFLLLRINVTGVMQKQTMLRISKALDGISR